MRHISISYCRHYALWHPTHPTPRCHIQIAENIRPPKSDSADETPSWRWRGRFSEISSSLYLLLIHRIVFKQPSGLTRRDQLGDDSHDPSLNQTNNKFRSDKMGGTRAEKEVYFTKLKALLEQYRESARRFGSGNCVG